MMTLQEEITEYVVTGQQNYKGWYCNYVGVGTVVFTKNGKEDIKAYRGIEVPDDKWVEECWEECKKKIDEIELA